MKVKAVASFASPVITPAPGQEFDVSDEQARDWIKAGLVIPVTSEPEKATRASREKAVSRKR